MTPHGWDKLKFVINETQCSNKEAYINEWKSFAVNHLKGSFWSPGGHECWVFWLIDSYLADDSGDLFIRKTRKWLNGKLKKSSPGFSDDYSLLSVLTTDLMNIKNDLLDEFPVLKMRTKSYNHLINDSFMEFTSHGDTAYSFCRRKALKECDAQNLVQDLLGAWRKNIEMFIPSPTECRKARYQRPAKWLAIARELNLEAYEKVLNEWREQHFRKINLWNELEDYEIKK